MNTVILLILVLLPGMASAESNAPPVQPLALNEVLDAALRALMH